MKIYRIINPVALPVVFSLLAPCVFGKPTLPAKDTITLVSFNDFHGSFQETSSIPGAARLTATILALRQTDPNVFVLADGDNFSGGYFPRMTGGRPLKEMFDRCGVRYSAIGNHEFDWGIEAMKERFFWGRTRYLSANIFEDSCGMRPDWAIPYAIEKQTLKNGTPVRIAFIGLSTPETKTAALPEIVGHLDFADPAEVAEELMRQLKDSADLYILLTHIGTDMKYGEVIFSDANARDLTQIPGIAGIFSGHSHKSVCALRNGVPVVQAWNYGRQIARLQYEITRKRNGKIQSRFLSGELLSPGTDSDPVMAETVERYLNDPQYGFSRPLTENRQELAPDAFVGRSGFSYLGALVTQSYQESYRRALGEDAPEFVLGICNLGAIRTALPQGEITRLQAGNIVPFGGSLNAFRMTGVQLRELLQYGIECRAGWLQYHNMELDIENGKIISMTYVRNGKRIPVEETGIYTVVAENFIASGGDGYDPSLFQTRDESFAALPAEQRNPTDVFIDYLDRLPQIDQRNIAVPVLR